MSIGPIGDRLGAPVVVRTAGILALGVFLLLLLSGRTIDLLGSTPRILLVVAWPLVLAAFWASGRISIPVLYIFGGGVLLRLYDFPAGGGGASDVLSAIDEAIAVTLSGGNAYTHAYQDTRPPGGPMPYPPGALVAYLPGHLWAGRTGLQMTELVLAMVALATFVRLGLEVAWIAALPAMAVYAAAPNLVTISLDGSNDTGVGAVLMLALLALMLALERPSETRMLIFAGLLGALAVAMKQTAAPMIVLAAIYVWRGRGNRPALLYAGAGLALLGLLSAPYLVLDAGAYVSRLTALSALHDDIFGWNIWTLARGLGWSVLEAEPALALNLLVGGVALVIAALLPIRRLDGAVAAGVVVTLVILLTARWTSYSYFAALAPTLLMLPAIVVWQAQRWNERDGGRSAPPEHQPDARSDQAVRAEDDRLPAGRG